MEDPTSVQSRHRNEDAALLDNIQGRIEPKLGDHLNYDRYIFRILHYICVVP